MNEQLDRIEIKLAELTAKVDGVYASSEKMRKYMLWGFWLTVGAIVIPLLVLPLLLPSFFSAEGVDSSSFNLDSIQGL